MKNIINRTKSYCRLQNANRKIEQAVKTGLLELPFGPSSLNLMMADACNSQCIMCGKDYHACGSKSYLSLEDIKKIYCHLDMGQVVDVIYGGGGEPFLNPDLDAIAALTRECYPVVQHTVISNFIQWKPEMVRRMLEAGVHFLLSVNAASRSTYQQVTGVDAYDAVIEHLKNLIALRKECRAAVNIAVSLILMEQNIEELSDFIRMAAHLGTDEVKTLYVRIYPAGHRHKANRNEGIQEQQSLFFHQQKSDKRVKEAEILAKELGIKFFHEPLFSCSSSCERNCDEAWKSLFINFNGDVYPCPASEVLFRPKVDSGMYNSGNILEQPIEKFWNNEFWKALRDTNRKHNRKDRVPECLCCGNAINWLGCGAKASHILDWTKAESSDQKL